MWKRIKFYGVFAIVVAVGSIVLYIHFFGGHGVVRRVVDAPALVQQIQQLNELVTVKYSIQKIIGLKEEKVPFGSESVLLMVQATVLGGVDLSTLQPSDVTVSAGTNVTIKLPQPQPLHVFMDDSKTKVWDHTKTWWTPWVPYNPELEQQARRDALEAVQAAALEMGILKDARQNAETAIRNFLRTTGIQSVTFEPVSPASTNSPTPVVAN